MQEMRMSGNFIVSRCGRVVTDLDGTPCEQKLQRGYWVVWTGNWYKDAKRVPVHRLVAMAWVPGYFDEATVDHLNGDKWDNSADNLEWVTRKENAIRGNHKQFLSFPTVVKRMWLGGYPARLISQRFGFGLSYVQAEFARLSGGTTFRPPPVKKIIPSLNVPYFTNAMPATCQQARMV